MGIRLAGETVAVPDLTAIVQGIVSKLVGEGRLRGRVVVRKEIIAYLEQAALRDQAVGYAGLEELKRLRELSARGLIRLEYTGDESVYKTRELDESALNMVVRDYAMQVGGIVVTGSRVAKMVAEAMGVDALLYEPENRVHLSFERFFDENTMSVHIKENTQPVAKKGRPGDWSYVRLSDGVLTRREIEQIVNEIVEEARRREDSFIEIDRPGSSIIQLGLYRVVVTRPPMSDGWELTIVRPLKKLRLEDYNLPAKLISRLNERAEGILIAGAPGMGKTTFAQALAEYYFRRGKIVKTVESPRDMVLPEEVTQYSKTYADARELHDILLLSRPDYTVFDEMRTDEDFKLYADLRLAGIGMIGVVHATSPIDAIQRFIGRVELGMIPSLVDTVIFIKNGLVEKVYDVRMTVKLPTGLKEAELSRPVVEVRDFMTDELEYEIYTFGEQTVVVPVKKLKFGRQEGHRLYSQLERLFPGARLEEVEDGVVISIPRDSANKYVKSMRKLRKLMEKYKVNIRVKLE
ncbi:PINc/VapC family ATPase [Thermogladius sp. KZ2Tp1]|uniref:PINc/VapC family ATPase n=1 Tax=Thermogladius sp. KZ2Tp1 TaxID=3136289 RepID=UPI003DA9C1B2